MVSALSRHSGERKKRKANHWVVYLFVFLMLLYPVAHFCLMWFGVNINSIFLAFKRPNDSGVLTWTLSLWDGKSSWLEALFYNFKTLFMGFSDKTQYPIYVNSLMYFVISCLITLPISFFFSYFVFKKVAGSAFFKVIFYLPSILPLLILCMAYKYSLSPGGLIPGLLTAMGIDCEAFFADLFIASESKRWLVWVFCIWAGIGYDVILLTAGMSRIPRDILESCKMDGVNPFREFFKIIVPLTWPTFTTLFIFGMMSVFNVTFQPFFLTAVDTDTETIGLYIYNASRGTGLHEPATLGLFCSLIGAPVILGARSLLNRCFKNVGF